jgi:hypothetical protein
VIEEEEKKKRRNMGPQSSKPKAAEGEEGAEGDQEEGAEDESSQKDAHKTESKLEGSNQNDMDNAEFERS